MANLVAAEIVIGFSIGQPGTTIRLAVAALAMWSAAIAVSHHHFEEDIVTNALLLFGGMVAIGGLFVLYDWIATRIDRRRQHEGS